MENEMRASCKHLRAESGLGMRIRDGSLCCKRLDLSYKRYWNCLVVNELRYLAVRKRNINLWSEYLAQRISLETLTAIFDSPEALMCRCVVKTHSRAGQAKNNPSPIISSNIAGSCLTWRTFAIFDTCRVITIHHLSETMVSRRGFSVNFGRTTRSCQDNLYFRNLNSDQRRMPYQGVGFAEL